MKIRQATENDAKAMAEIHVDSWKKAYKGILPDELLINLSYEDREKRWSENINEATSGGSMMYVAEDKEHGVIGFVLGGTMRDATLRMRYTAEIYGLYVHPDHQLKGVGTSLFNCIAEFLGSIYHARAGLWILEEHPDRPFFEKQKTAEIYRKPEKIREKTHTNIAYGIEDLSVYVKEREMS